MGSTTFPFSEQLEDNFRTHGYSFTRAWLEKKVQEQWEYEFWYAKLFEIYMARQQIAFHPLHRLVCE